MHECELSGNFFCGLFGDVFVDLEVHVLVNHFVGVDLLVVGHLLGFTLHCNLH